MRGKSRGRGADGHDRPDQQGQSGPPRQRRDAHEDDVLHDFRGHRRRRQRATEIRRQMSRAECSLDREPHRRRGADFAEPLEHHRRAEDRSDGIGDASDRRCRAPTRARARTATAIAARVEIRRRIQPETAGDAAGQIAEDVAEQVGADDDVEGVRTPHELQRGGVDVQFLGSDVGILLAPIPQAPGPRARSQIAARSTW